MAFDTFSEQDVAEVVGGTKASDVGPTTSDSRDWFASALTNSAPVGESASEALQRFIESEQDDIVSLAISRTEDAISKAAAAKAAEASQKAASTSWQHSRDSLIARLRSQKSFAAKFGEEETMPKSLFGGVLATDGDGDDVLSPATPLVKKPQDGLLGVVAMHVRTGLFHIIASYHIYSHYPLHSSLPRPFLLPMSLSLSIQDGGRRSGLPRPQWPQCPGPHPGCSCCVHT